ncbi:MAG TPA: Uma2 family endonuclease [Gemmatimonadaceae bacterium]|nr:Uma2 family endonuclease [Gemmatimonadaceae bacterium]
MGTTTELLTVDEFLSRLSHDEPVELVDGVVRPMTPTGGAHGLVCGRLVVLLGRALDVAGQPSAGVVFTEMAAVRLFRDRESVRCPDVSVVLAARLLAGGLPTTGALTVVPDLVAEVLSPAEAAWEVEEKRAEYLAAGVRLVWIVDPRTRAVTVYRPDAAPIRLTRDDLLSGEPVLPAFRHPVGRLFDGLAAQ